MAEALGALISIENVLKNDEVKIKIFDVNKLFTNYFKVED